MKEATGSFQGWRCPQCKRLVKAPSQMKTEGLDEAKGICSVCNIPLLFRKVKFKVEEPEGPPETRIKPALTKEEVIDYYFPKRSFETGKERPLGSGFEGRWVFVNFLNRPRFLKALESYAERHNLLLSEVVVGFAAKGFKEIVEKIKGGK